MFIKLRRILSTTHKDLLRNKAITISSISVMSLVFLVFSIFTLFAFTSYKVIRYIETRVHFEVFFNPDAEEDQIMAIKKVIEDTGKTVFVEYTSQEEAAEFIRRKYSDETMILGATTPDALPASLAIKANKIDYVPELVSVTKSQDATGDLIYKFGYNEDTTNTLKDLLFWIRIAGVVLFTFLVAVIFLVSLITVEMSITSRGEEINIMQLVGGGRWFIRAPFVFQGAFYGIAGAFIAFLVIFASGAVFHFVKDQSPTLSFISDFFSEIDWPDINLVNVGSVFLGEILLGGLIGSVNSLIAVFRRL